MTLDLVRMEATAVRQEEATNVSVLTDSQASSSMFLSSWVHLQVHDCF